MKLRHLDNWGVARSKNAKLYRDSLKSVSGVVTTLEAPWAEHVYHQYTIRVKNRDKIQAALADQGVGTTAVHRQGGQHCIT